MPKQILFYMSRHDEEEFLRFLKSNGATVVLPATSPTSGFAPMDILPEASQDEASRKFWLHNSSIELPLVTELDESRGVYLINGFQSPVVEFLRSFGISNVMLPGRLEADMNYFDDDRKDLVSKPADFRKWFDTMEAWIRNNYRRMTLLTYIGPGAKQFEQQGGILH